MANPPFPIFPGATGVNKQPPTLLSAIANYKQNQRVTSRIDPRPMTLPKGIDFAALKKMTDALKAPSRVTSRIDPVQTRTPMPVKKPTPKQAVGHLVSAGLPPGIDFAALKRADDAKKAVAKPGAITLPPGIDFAALKAASTPKPAAPVDPLLAAYNQFKTEMESQGKDATKRYDDVIKAVGSYYDQANAGTDANYKVSKAELDDLIRNLGVGSVNTYGDLTSSVAGLKSLTGADKAANMASLAELKAVQPSIYQTLTQGLQGNYQDAALAQAQLTQQLAAEAAAARSGGGGGGGGGGGRRSSGGGRRRSSGGRSSGGGGGGYTDSAGVTYTSYDDYADIMNNPNLTAKQKADAQRAIILGGGNAVNVMKTLQNQFDVVSRTSVKPKTGWTYSGGWSIPKVKKPTAKQQAQYAVDLVKKAAGMGSIAQLMQAFLPHAPYLGGASVKRTSGQKSTVKRS